MRGGQYLSITKLRKPSAITAQCRLYQLRSAAQCADSQIARSRKKTSAMRRRARPRGSGSATGAVGPLFGRPSEKPEAVARQSNASLVRADIWTCVRPKKANWIIHTFTILLDCRCTPIQFNRMAIDARYHPSGNHRRLEGPVQNKRKEENRVRK